MKCQSHFFVVRKIRKKKQPSICRLLQFFSFPLFTQKSGLTFHCPLSKHLFWENITNQMSPAELRLFYILFSANNWTDPVLFNQIPVRAEIKGVQTKNNISKTFHHMYEYFDFRTHIWDGPSVFQVIYIFFYFTSLQLVLSAMWRP